MTWQHGMCVNQILASLAKLQEEDIIPSIPIFCQATTTTLPTITPSRTKNFFQKKTQETIKSLLDHVVGTFGALLASFQEFTNNLKNMDRNFDTLLDKLQLFSTIFFPLSLSIYCLSDLFCSLYLSASNT